MGNDTVETVPDTLRVAIPPDLARRLAEPLDAYRSAQEFGDPVWDFALTMNALHAAGLSETDVRRLVRGGVLLHQRETTADSPGPRTFAECSALAFTPLSAFVLSEPAAAFLAGQPAGEAKHPRIVPKWYARRRELWYDGHLVIAYQREACTQEPILAAFQKNRWKTRLTGMLPDLDTKRGRAYLRTVIRLLNRSRLINVICFYGDYSGVAICWRPVELDPEEVEPTGEGQGAVPSVLPELDSESGSRTDVALSQA